MLQVFHLHSIENKTVNIIESSNRKLRSIHLFVGPEVILSER